MARSHHSWQITDENSKKEVVKTFLFNYQSKIEEGKEMNAYIKGGVKTILEKVKHDPFETLLTYEDNFTMPLKVVGVDLDCENGAIMMSISKEDAQHIKESVLSNNGTSSSSYYSFVTFGNDAKTVDSFMDFFLEKAKNSDYDTMKEGDWYFSFCDNSLSYVEFVGNMLMMFLLLIHLFFLLSALFFLLLFHCSF